MSAEQKADVALVFGQARNAGLLDYVTCWHLKAADWMAGDNRAEACFVSTNSITQGEQPAILWAELWRRGVVINFAHRTFAWTSEARGKAAVHCVILAFALRARAVKQLWEYDKGKGEPREVMEVGAINPYLVDGPMVALPRRAAPLWNVPVLGLGNQPIDGGHYLFSQAEKDHFVAREPGAAGFFRPWIGADEFINGERRWCLYLADVSPSALRAMRLVSGTGRGRVRFPKGESKGGHAGPGCHPAAVRFQQSTNRLLFCCARGLVRSSQLYSDGL